MAPKQSELERRSSSELQSDIQRTRHEMDETLDQIDERLQPRHLLDEVLSWWQSGSGKQKGGEAIDGLRSAGRSLVRQVRDNPVPALLIGAGVAWMIFESASDDDEFDRRSPYGPEGDDRIYEGPYSDISADEFYEEPVAFGLEPAGASERVSAGATSQTGGKAWGREGEADDEKGVMGKAMEHVKEGAHRVGEAAAGAARAVSGTASAAKDAASRGVESVRQGGRAGARHIGQWGRGAAEDARRRGSRMTSRLREGTREGRERFADSVEEYPLATAFGFMAAGLLTGLLLPPTRSEDRLMGEQADDVKRRMMEVGEEAVDRGREAATRVAHAGMENAQQEGLSPSSLSEKVQRVAKDVKDAAVESAHREGVAPDQLADKAKKAGQRTGEAVKGEAERQKQDVKKKKMP